jgi:hypothetical protein
MKNIKPLFLLPEILKYARPHDSAVEQAFCDRFIGVLPGIEQDTYGNYMLEVGSNPSTLFSAHTDTVDWEEGFKNVICDPNLNQLFTDNGSCLGADDGTGIWIMLQMIFQKIPGMYVFHRGEEVGCLGSGWLAENRPDWLGRFDHAIAFDRQDDRDIITHQRYGKCASTNFVDDFSTRLYNTGHITGMPHQGARGVYTDTAEYTHLIAECTNLSVGYKHQHSSSETQCLNVLSELAPALLKMDWEGITSERVPEKRVEYSYGRVAYPNFGKWKDEYDYDWDNTNAAKTYVKDEHPSDAELLEFVEYFPQQVAELLREWGVTIDEIAESMCGDMSEDTHDTLEEAYDKYSGLEF